jgi:hypothetical protein
MADVGYGEGLARSLPTHETLTVRTRIDRTQDMIDALQGSSAPSRNLP